MTYFNENVRYKSYCLEFYTENTDKPEEAIFFSIPPQNENITHAQRINKTNTFGGAVVDDYGNDLISIRLSGSTVNQELRYVNYANQKNVLVTGAKEIEKIESIIYKYGQLSKLKNKKVLLYSLDNTKLNNCWYVNIENFDIKRSIQNPMAYNYELKVIGNYPKNSRLENLRSDNTQNLIDKINKTKINLAAAEEKIKVTDEVVNALFKGSKFLASGITKLRDIEKKIFEINDFMDNLTNSITSYSDVVKSYITETKTLGKIIVQAIVRNTVGFSYNIADSVVDVIEEALDFVEWTNNILEDSNYDIYFTNLAATSDVQFGVSTQETKDNFLSLVSSILTVLFEIKADSDDVTNTTSSVTVPGDENTDDVVINVYNYFIVIVKDSDTWESLSNKHYKRPDLGKVIAAYNPEVSSLEAGIEIKIPNLEETESNRINFTGSKDNYGSDISITNGDFEVKNGDLYQTKGIKTLTQSVNHRLMTSRDSRIRYALYGINAQIGQPQLSESYILSSIEETLLQDPRIQSVDNIEFQGKGDNLIVNVNYTDINGNKNNYGGII